MSFEVGITSKGIKGAQKALSEFQNEIGDEVKTFLTDLGNNLSEEMVIDAPVDTGFMAEHIGVSSVTNEQLVIDSEATYSGFVEFGTVKMQAQPFFMPPIDELKSKGTTIENDLGEKGMSLWDRLVNEHEDE